MTSIEFQSEESLVKAWKEELQSNEALKLALSVCDEEAPLHEEADTASETNALVAYGYEKGYAAYGRKLFELAKLKKAPDYIRTTYGVKDA